jgi:hypothetical protein
MGERPPASDTSLNNSSLGDFSQASALGAGTDPAAPVLSPSVLSLRDFSVSRAGCRPAARRWSWVLGRATLGTVGP